MRPVLLLAGGLLLMTLLQLADQRIAAIAVALFSLFMAYWTSPLRSGPHLPLAQALSQGTGTTVILWAPGNPLSARLQAVIRSPREDVVWVNVFRDPQAQQLLAEHGGADALPLVLLGGQTITKATPGDLLDLQTAVLRGRPEGGDVSER